VWRAPYEESLRKMVAEAHVKVNRDEKNCSRTALLGCPVYRLLPPAAARAPGFCLSDTTGEWRDLADYRGKIVLVEFMQTNCPHCAAFSAVLNGLKLKYADKLAILAVANPPDNPQTMTQFVPGTSWLTHCCSIWGRCGVLRALARHRSAGRVSDRRQRNDSQLLAEWRADEGHFRRQRLSRRS